MKVSNLGKRLLFVLWAAPLGWWLINSSFSIIPRSVAIIYPGHIGITFIILMALFEYTRMLSIFYPRNGFWLSYVWLVFQFGLYFMNDVSLPFNFSIYTLLIVVAVEAFLWEKNKIRRSWVRASLLFSGNVFLYIAAISLFNLYQEPFQSMFRKVSDNSMLSQLGIATVFASIFLCDTGAYIVGSLWGKTHFSNISPKKTIEGSLGGLVFATVVASIGWYFFAATDLPRWLGIPLGIIIGVFAQIGDLLVSLMKRFFRVKDASHIIPGHGGILDRFDSVFFTAPMVSLFSWVIIRIYG